MNIFEINKELREMLELFELESEETGEISEDTYQRIKELEVARDKKIEGIALWVKELKHEEEAIKEEEQKLRKKRQAVQNSQKYYKNLLMTELGGEKYKTPLVSLSFRTVPVVNILSEESIPKEYIYETVERHISKEDIKEALKRGEVVDGAELKQSTSLIIR